MYYIYCIWAFATNKKHTYEKKSNHFKPKDQRHFSLIPVNNNSNILTSGLCVRLLSVSLDSYHAGHRMSI